MNRNSIIKLPNPALLKRSRRVGLIDDHVKKVISNMKAATLDWEAHREHEFGVVLAAVQIDEPLRIVVVRSNFEDKANHDFQVFINPEITKFDGELSTELEGCLSVPDLYGKVPRYSRVKVKALDQNRQPVRVTAEGFLARVFQHEIDHTNGKTYAQRIGSDGDYFVMKPDGKLDHLDTESKAKILDELKIK